MKTGDWKICVDRDSGAKFKKAIVSEKKDFLEEHFGFPTIATFILPSKLAL